MVSINVDLSLSDIGSVIEFAANSDSERREVLDFVLDVDQFMADVHWSLDLVAELANSVAQESIDGEFRKTSIPVPTELPVPGDPEKVVTVPVHITVPNLAKALAAIDPEMAVQIYAESQELRKQELAKIERAKAAVECVGCGHTYGEHDGTCLAEEPGLGGAFTWRCECSEFEEEKAKDRADECVRCGHTRSLHHGGHLATQPGPEACEGAFLSECACPFFKEKEE